MTDIHITCPQCNRARDPLNGLTVNNITTPDDQDLGLVRYAIRCEGCGYATAFIAAPRCPDPQEKGAPEEQKGAPGEDSTERDIVIFHEW